MKIGTVGARRFFPAILLAAALVILILGLTALSPQLKGLFFIIYWLICFLLTGAAAIVALIDVSLMRRELKRQQRELIESTLAQVKGERGKNSSTTD